MAVAAAANTSQEHMNRIGLNQNEFGSFNVSMSISIYFDHSKSILIKNDFFKFDIVQNARYHTLHCDKSYCMHFLCVSFHRWLTRLLF